MKQSFYKESILFFGFILPGLLSVVLCGGLWFAQSHITESLKQREAVFSQHKRTETEIKQLETQIAPRRDLAKDWEQLIRKDASTEISDKLQGIFQTMPSREFVRTSSNPSNNRTGLFAASKQNAVQLQLSFRGTYRGLQKGFLMLESRLPNLQINDLRIDVNGQTSNLNMQVNYGAWIK